MKVAQFEKPNILRMIDIPLEGVHEALRYQREGLTLKSILQPNA